MEKTDTSIAAGLTCEEFVKKAIKSIYLKQIDVIITHEFIHNVGIVLKNIFPALISRMTINNL